MDWTVNSTLNSSTTGKANKIGSTKQWKDKRLGSYNVVDSYVGVEG